MKAPFLVGRLVFGGFFLYNGINHFLQHKTLSQYVQAKKVPMADIAVAVSGIALIVVSTSILLGVKPKLGAAAIIGFLASASPTMHDFWRSQDPKQRMDDTINFAKHMALLGGALALLAVEESPAPPLPTTQQHRSRAPG